MRPHGCCRRIGELESQKDQSLSNINHRDLALDAQQIKPVRSSMLAGPYAEPSATEGEPAVPARQSRISARG